MKIHLQDIPEEGLHLEGTEDQDILNLEPSEGRVVSPVAYALDVGISEDGVFGTGTLRTTLEFECVTCLSRFHYDLRIDPFAFHIDHPGNDVVDLTDTFREDILLALPPHPHCDWDGVNECQGVRTATFGTGRGKDGTQEEPNAWDALNQLNIKKTK